MSLLGGNPERGSKTSGSLAQIAYQQERSKVGADIECGLENNIPIYFAQASFGVYME